MFVARAVVLVEHVADAAAAAAAGHDASRHVVAASVDAMCLPTRGSNGDPGTCSTLRGGPDHHQSPDAVDDSQHLDAQHHCSTGCSMALERGRPQSGMRKGYVRSPSTRGSRVEVAARCGGVRDIQRLSQTPCRGALTCSTIIILMALQNPRLHYRLYSSGISSLMLLFCPYQPIPGILGLMVWPSPRGPSEAPPDPSSLPDRQTCPQLETTPA